MSDKSKLGFNINPKSYDELNSTDNIITSGSDSGWLGNKLQGNNSSNSMDLSKINPLFDKELYERYRPGVNTNDGSVNQDIWGYKCFNSPVSFRNGIYGDTYSIQSVDTYTYDAYHDINNNGIIIQPYNKYAKKLNDKNNVFRIYNENINEKKNYNNITYVDSEEVYHQYGYTGKENNINTYDLNVYDILKSAHIDGTYNESISYEQNHELTNNDGAQLNLLINSYDYNVVGTSSSTRRKDTTSYNGITTFSNKKNDKQAYTYQDAVNITSSIYINNNIGTDEEPKHNYNISRITIGTECGNDPVIEKEITANNNCIRMYSADGTHGNSGYINDNISSIIITPEIINTSVDNKIITIDYHTDKLTGDDYNYSKPVIDIAFDYTKATDDPANLILFQMASLLNIQDATVSDAEDAVPSINVHGIFKYGNDDVIKYRGTRITPTSIAVNAIQFNRFIMGDTFISNIHNKLVPVEYIFKQNDNDETGINTYGLKLLGCDGKLKTSFICDYLVVNESIKYKSAVSYTDRLVYIDPETNNTTNVLTVQSNNLILPRGNKTIKLGSTDNRFGTIYGDLNGTADKAKADEHGHNIAKTYFDKNSNNTITGATTISRPGDVLRILPNSLDEEDHCSINIATSDVDMRYKTTLNVHQQDNTNLACSLSLYAYHNNDVSSFSILPSVESTTSGIVNDNVALNIGGKNNYFTNIYCKNFPTVHNTLIGHGVSASGSLQTSIGCIRLLCVEIRPVQVAINEQIRPGFAIRDGKITIDGNEYPVYLAGFDVEDQSNSIRVKPISDSVVTDSWYSLSGIFLAHNTESYVKYIPILAIRSY